MKKIVSLLMIFIALSAGTALFAADAEITYVKGKVEVQRGNEWVSLKPGDKISKNEMISTGFQSEAKVKLLDSIMCLGPVTRITLEELTAGKTQDKVNVYLKTGSVRSKVNHAESKRVNYQVHTAIAVASARGTDYSMFSTGETVVTSGIVGVAAYIPPAESSSSDAETVEEESEEQTESSADSETSSESTESSSSDSTEEAAPAAAPAPEQKVVLVKANQSAKVSSSGSVSAPVSKAVQSVSAVVQAASTAASKESVQSASSSVVSNTVTSISSTQNNAVENVPVVEETPVENKPSTGTVEISVIIE